MDQHHTAAIPLYTAAQSAELDRLAMQECGIPGYTLMCHAGAAAFALLRERWPKAARITLLCGLGNNAGDGYVVARLARDAGLDVSVLQLGDSTQLRGDALTAYNDMRRAAIVPRPFSPEALGDAQVLVDAILGTGLQRPVEGEWQAAIDAINRHPAPVLALDMPSGLHADTGQVLGTAVVADATITFLGRKRGLYTGAGPNHTGAIQFDSLQVDPAVYARVPAQVSLFTHPPLGPLARPRPRCAHKGELGHVLVLGGGPGMAGAVRLAGEAAARCGAGLVSLATHPGHAGLPTAARPELMCHGVAGAAALAPLLARATVLAVGPGLGRSDWARTLLAAAMDSALPLVVDADALNLLALQPEARGRWVLTPHPGEAARLLACSVAEIEADRFAAVAAIADRYQAVCVLKGAGSLVAQPGEITALCGAGNPGMATGGMGDVLTGVIAALIAQGLELGAAARAGVGVHARAGDAAAAAGERGLMAGDVVACLRAQMNPPLSS